MQIQTDQKKTVESKGKDAVSRMELIHKQTGDPIAQSTAAVFQEIGLAISCIGKDPKSARYYIDEARMWLSQSTQELLGSNGGRMNQAAYGAIIEDQTKALNHLLNGNVKMAAFLLETAATNAHGIYDVLRVGGQIVPQPGSPGVQQSLTADDSFGSYPARLTDVFRNAYERCTALLSKTFASNSKEI